MTDTTQATIQALEEALALSTAQEPENPRTCNTGVPNLSAGEHTPPPAPTGTARFDYYRATPEASFGEIIEGIEHAFPEGLDPDASHWKPGRAFYGYEEAHEHQILSLVVFTGGKHPRPLIQSSGEDADKIAEWLRDCEVPHKVSRADVCWDFKAEGSFEAIKGIIEPRARDAKAQVTLVGDPDAAYSDRGRTLYFGSRKSDAFARLYEKGYEQQQKGVADADPNWVRLEVQIQPRKERKRIASTLTARQMVGFSSWLNEAVEATVAEHAPFIPDPSIRKSKDAQALTHMASQYGRAIKAKVEAEGWEAFNLELYRAIYTPKERAKMEGKSVAPTPFRRAPKGQAKPALDLVSMIEREMQAARH